MISSDSFLFHTTRTFEIAPAAFRGFFGMRMNRAVEIFVEPLDRAIPRIHGPVLRHFLFHNLGTGHAPPPEELVFAYGPIEKRHWI